MKVILITVMVMTAALFCAAKELTVENRSRLIMTDAEGMPLDDGSYEVVFKIYDSPKDGILIAERKETVESKNGVCMMREGILEAYRAQGFKQIWVSIKIEDQPESKFRMRIFLDRE